MGFLVVILCMCIWRVAKQLRRIFNGLSWSLKREELVTFRKVIVVGEKYQMRWMDGISGLVDGASKSGPAWNKARMKYVCIARQDFSLRSSPYLPS